jgi:hypothetical protein
MQFYTNRYIPNQILFLIYVSEWCRHRTVSFLHRRLFSETFYFTVYVTTNNCSMVYICNKQLQIPDPFLFGVCPHHDEVSLCNVRYRTVGIL